MSRSVTLRVIMKIGVEIFMAVKKLDLNFRAKVRFIVLRNQLQKSHFVIFYDHFWTTI